MERTLGLRTADVNQFLFTGWGRFQTLGFAGERHQVKGDRKGASGVDISILEAASESQVQPGRDFVSDDGW